jgi:hypothetical protein
MKVTNKNKRDYIVDMNAEKFAGVGQVFINGV